MLGSSLVPKGLHIRLGRQFHLESLWPAAICPSRLVPSGHDCASSSLDLLLEINQSERHAQLSHFDGLDTKAGLVLGFAGVLIALGNETVSLFGIAAAFTAGAAVASFWPRRFPSIVRRLN